MCVYNFNVHVLCLSNISDLLYIRYSPDMAQHYSRLTDEDHQETSGKFAELYQLTK